LIEEVRNIRGMFNVKPKALLDLTVSTDEEYTSFIKADQSILKKLAGVSAITYGEVPAGQVATIILPRIHAYVGLPGVDISREKTRLQVEIKELVVRIDDINHRLNNPQYLAKADEEIKSREQERLDNLLRKKSAIESAIERL
jgi:valyl-tRNA synthetase